MNIVINSNGLKRQLNFPFEICLDQRSLKTLKDCLSLVDENTHNYGWITIYEKPIIHAVANQVPLPWKEEF